MPEHFRALIVILVLAGIVFALVCCFENNLPISS